MIGYVYCLKDKDGTPFYVGATIQHPDIRLSCHLSLIKVNDSYTPPVYDYMRENNIRPEMEILESKNYRKRRSLLSAEAKWISRLKRRGHFLTNKCLKCKIPKD